MTPGEKIFAMFLVTLYFGACVLMVALSIWCFDLSAAAEAPSFMGSLQSAFGIFTGMIGGAGVTLGFFLLADEVFR